MKIAFAINQLRAGGAAFAALFDGWSDEEARWRPDPASWSLLEVACHLLDEEREDFRQRLDLTLHAPATEWPPIDPAGWVTARAYNSRDLATVVAELQAERQASLTWLEGLRAPDLEQFRRHPQGFTLRAGDLLAAWVAHDSLHLRQLNELRYALIARRAAPYSVEYAGEW
jgi:hypothetical protein